MNGKVAKRIRKKIYGIYKEEEIINRQYDEQSGGQLLSVGKRRKYKLAKKEYNLKNIQTKRNK